MDSKLDINDHTFELFIDHQRIKARITELAGEFNQELIPGITFVPVMAGAFYFAGEFLHHIDKPYQLMSVQASSYNGVHRTGKVRISFLKEDRWIRDGHIVILEDIIDSGRTAHELEKFFYARGAVSVEVIALFYKPGQQKFQCNLSLFGFEVGPEFLVGYGLDVDEEGRHLKDVYRLIDR